MRSFCFSAWLWPAQRRESVICWFTEKGVWIMSAENFKRFVEALYSLPDDEQEKALARMETKLAEDQAENSN